MPWKLRREIYLILIGVAMLTLSSIVLVRNTSIDTELLGTIGAASGLAIILVSLPVNGRNGDHDG
jgi:hypothetical protein